MPPIVSAEARSSACMMHGLGSPAARWPLAGREKELEAFARVLASRRSRGVVLVGPAGVGKSRLAEEFLAQAVRTGFKGGRATASAAAANVPLGAIAHLLPAGVNLSDPVERFATVAAALSADSKRRCVVWVDDLHLLDTTSAMLLRQLMDAGLIKLIATVRSGDLNSEAVQALAQGDAVARIDLVAFDRAQVETFLQAALGGTVGSHTVGLLYEVSGGNALYLRELVHGALAAGVLTSDGEVWHLAPVSKLPATERLNEVIDTHLALAGPAGRPVLELLSLCGPLPLAEVRATSSEEVLDHLERTGLIRVDRDGRRTYVVLAQPLYGETLRVGLTAVRRRGILLGQAERLEACGARRQGDALSIATWRLAATGTAAPAVLLKAAMEARNAHDYPHAITLLQALPETRHTAQTRLMLGEALSETGRWKEADLALNEAASHAVSEQEKLALTLALTVNLAWSNTDPTQALAANDTAQSGATSPAQHRALQVNKGFLRIAAGQTTCGLALLDDLEATPSSSLDIRAWIRGALAKAVAWALTGHTLKAATWAKDAYTTQLQLEDQTPLPHPAIQMIPLILAQAEAGLLNDARITGEDSYQRLTHSSLIVRTWTALVIGRTQWLAGHPASARRWYAEAAALARSINHAKALRPALAGLAASAAILGDLDAAETALDEHRTTPPVSGFLPASEESLGHAWLLAARGCLTQARNVLTEAAKTARDTGCLASETLLLTDIARLGGAKDVSDRLTELAQNCDSPFTHTRARLATALAEKDPARLLHLVGELEEHGAHLLAAEAATTAATTWYRTGQSRRATAATHQAARAAAQCQGARTPSLAPADTTAPLTPREREIALLAAITTRTSKDIAQTLHLSVRTIDNHLQRIYTKLGVTTRRELATTLDETAKRSV
ncbi:AAA family ATPase [Streptomyces sp. NPDC001139]